MNRRLASGFVCWLYLSVALLTGLFSHNHRHGVACQHNGCAACVLQINLVADVPVVNLPVLAGGTIAAILAPVKSVFNPIACTLATASRAPPGASA